MNIIKDLNKAVGVVTLSTIVIGGVPTVVQATTIDSATPKPTTEIICNDINKSIKDGTYKSANSSISEYMNKLDYKSDEIEVNVLKENSDQTSMAKTYIKKVEHQIIDGRNYLVLSMDSIDWMSNITISTDDGTEIQVDEIERSIKDIDDGKGKEIGKIRFEITDLNFNILMHMNVSPMGDAKVGFRLISKTSSTITENSDNQKETSQQEKDTKVSSQTDEKNNKSVENNISDGVYSISFTAYKVEDRNEVSMLNNFFDEKGKLEVKDGKMKLTLLNTCFADGLYDFRIESDGIFPESLSNGYGELTPKGEYPFKTFEMNLSDITKEHQGCVLVGPMGGLISDIGNFDKYRKVVFVFDYNNLSEWNGFNEDHKKVDNDKKFNKALLDANLDIDGDKIVTNEELALAEGDINLARKELKDISRLKFLGKNVTSLDLTGNEITELPKGIFDNLTKLKKLDLHGNFLKEIPEGIFDNLTELTELHIGMNSFNTLPEEVFYKLTNLKELSIYRVPLKDISDNLFSTLKNLEYLSLEESGINKIPSSISNLTNLKTLNLIKNEIKVIPKDLANLTNLTWFDLEDNYIEEIPDEIYKSLNKLTMFGIKGNQLTKVPLNILEYMPEITMLNCSFNKLDVIPQLSKLEKEKIWFTAYPQKQCLNLMLNAKNGELSWTQDNSSVDILAWWKIANSFNTKKIPETFADYKEQLNEKSSIDFLKEKWTEPQVITKIQKKCEDGSYITIKEINNYNEDDHSDSIKDLKMKNGDEYRIIKIVEAVSYGSPLYVCKDIAYATAVVDENTKELDMKNAKSIKVDVLKENSNEQSMAKDYVNNIVKYIEQDGKKYFIVTLNRLDWMKDIDIQVNGVSVVAEEKSDGNIGEFTFEVESEMDEIKMNMNILPMNNSRVSFRLINSENTSKDNDVNLESNKSDESKDNDVNLESSKSDESKNNSNKDDKTTLKESGSDKDSIYEKNLNNNQEKINVKSDKTIQSESNSINKTSGENKLPQTGLPINRGNLLSLGVILSILGALLRKK